MVKQDNYLKCMLCPHQCGVNRRQGERGICAESATVRLAWVGFHKGEEPPLVEKEGSGTLFFSGCTLHCPYCQNREISRRFTPIGKAVSVGELASLFLSLQAGGAANLNLVTATHFIPSIVEALDLALEQGLTLPVVYNTSGYESVEGLALIDPFVDTYLFDINTLSRNVASQFCGSRDYPEVVLKAVEFLKEKHPTTFIDAQGVLKGLLVRHLVFPGCLDASKEFLHWFAANLKDNAWLSLMVQFVDPSGERKFPPLEEKEWQALIDLLAELSIEEGFVQELGDEDEWIPHFSAPNPFPEDFAKPLQAFMELAN
ncbi:MAG: radical SAM protein [Sphaerochaetaceae bacterium]